MKKYLIIFAFLLVSNTASANTTGYAWSESVGWFDFSNAVVSDTALTGHAYNDNTGWLVLSNITNDGSGLISGHAWSESVGWFDFSDVTINNGSFSGYAYNDNTGWLSFEDGTNVTTTWAPASPVEERTRSSRSGSRKRVMIATTTPIVNTPNTIPNINTPNSTPSNLITDISNNPRDLELGMEGNDVKKLQQFLNSKGFIINPNPGQPGSIGYETNYFGNMTKQALIKFQIANNINPSLGYFGPKTRVFIKTLGN